jgi:hypothetical protein
VKRFFCVWSIFYYKQISFFLCTRVFFFLSGSPRFAREDGNYRFRFLHSFRFALVLFIFFFSRFSAPVVIFSVVSAPVFARRYDEAIQTKTTHKTHLKQKHIINFTISSLPASWIAALRSRRRKLSFPLFPLLSYFILFIRLSLPKTHLARSFFLQSLLIRLCAVFAVAEGRMTK